MAQALPRYCPRCGTPTRADMRYCATCELPVEAMLSRPGDRTELGSQGVMSEPAIIPTPRQMQQGDQAFRSPGPSQDFPPAWNASIEDAPHFSPSPPVSPGGWGSPGNIPSNPGMPLSPGGWGSPGNVPSNPGMSPWAATQAEPQHFSPQAEAWHAGGPQSQWGAPVEPAPPSMHSPAPQSKGRRRTGLLVVLLVVLLVLGGGGYLAFSLLGGHFPGLGSSQSTIQTKNLNLAFPYAGINVTLLNVQQAQNFVDDPHSAGDGMLRLNLQEQNKTTVPINYDYNASARLVAQGKAALAPTYVKSPVTIAPGATQTSVVDFAVPNGGNLNALTFQLGTASEARMQIPLAGQNNLSQYQPKTTAQNGTAVYFGLNWTLTSSTASFSIPGQQATTGMEYLTLSVKIDNPLSQQAISGSPFDYMRVKAGGKTVSPVGTTIPVSFAAGETGKAGTATFLIPQNSTACTLILLSQDPGGSGQASTDFQI